MKDVLFGTSLETNISDLERRIIKKMTTVFKDYWKQFVKNLNIESETSVN
jgi:hypothetical protein